jgi:DUF4097 and DUF4098 domain-containing protein YvlB
MIRTRAWLVPLLLLAAAASGADEKDDDRTWSAEPDVRIDIEIISGDIEIEGWQRNEVRVRTQGGGQDSLGVEASPDWISIRAPGPRGWLGGVGEVDLRIELPVGSRVRAKSINGSIEVRDVRGSITAHATNGDIDVEGAPREANLETLSSNIELRGPAGRVAARAVSGSIQLEGVSEEVEATTMSGSIQVEAGTLQRVDLRTLSGSIELDAALARDARAHLETHSGSVQLTLPQATSAHFDVQSFSGGIDNEFGVKPRSRQLGGVGRRLDFQVGDGDAQVTIKTFSGGVDIEAKD